MDEVSSAALIALLTAGAAALIAAALVGLLS
jgi:hypothetical protein